MYISRLRACVYNIVLMVRTSLLVRSVVFLATAFLNSD